MDVFTLASNAITIRLKSLYDIIIKDFGSEIKHIINNKILEYQVEEYNRNYITKTLLHRVQPKRLMDFYQPLFIVPCGKGGERTYNNETRISTASIQELFKTKQFITLIGSAGSGKSTIVKYLFLNAIDTNYKIPVKVELRYLNDYSDSVINFIKDRIFKLEKLANNDKIIERLLSSGDFVFFLDGYDEITFAKKERITKEIDDLVKIYNKNNYLLTSRPYTEIDLLPLFHNFEVCNLSDDDINQFIRKQIPLEESELCEKIIESVNNQENISYKSFLSNPLLLSMFILTFQSYSNIPQKRSEFYSQVFDALFSVHDSMSKLAFVREKQSGLSKEYFIEVLKLFSFISFFDDKFIFSGLYLDQKLSFIKEKKKTLAFENNKLVNDLQVAIGILNKEGTDYTFPHRSLQEYFAAVYIASLDETNKVIVYSKILSTITSREDSQNYSRENFYLMLSEMDEKSVIKYALLPYFDNYINTFKINRLGYNKILDTFFILRDVYDSFSYIIKENDLKIFTVSLSPIFEKYQNESDLQQEAKTNRRSSDLHRNYAFKKIAIDNIKPFLISYLGSMVSKRKELGSYLENETISDTEIISLI